MIKQSSLPLILASGSPRRREILEKMGLKFRIERPDFNENDIDPQSFDLPEKYALYLAEMKGKSISNRFKDSLILSADTIVIQGETILGKPQDRNEAIEILEHLSGKTHQVISALCLYCQNPIISLSTTESTDVVFRDLSREEIEDYVDICNPLDKAGAYGIQDVRASLVKEIHGCYFNVTGFPLAGFYKLWQDLPFSHTVD